MNKKTITIGIPAFNEEANIEFLLKDLISQNISDSVIDKIIVVSDGSTDKTVEIVKNINYSKIKLIIKKNREGLAKAENDIFSNSDSDIVVLLNADIEISDKRFISELIKPILRKKADLTCIRMTELEEKSFIGKILKSSMEFKMSVFENYKNGDNIYTCHGTARAFSRTLYKCLNFRESVGEDAYSYLFTKFNKFKYQYVNGITGYYKVPTNYKDHEKQSLRFLQSKKKFINEFGEDFVVGNYHLPTALLILMGLKYIAKYPVQMFLYVFIYSGIKIKSQFASKINDTWEISKSSKVLRAKSI